MATTVIEARDIEDLRSRLKRVELERARLEERRSAAIAARKEATDKLAELGYEPEDAAEELQHLYLEIEERLTELESLLDL